jgi:predicted nucleotidyltransferase
MDKLIQKSGLIKKEIDFLIPFIKEPWKDFTLSEIKSITKNNSHHYIYEALEKFSSHVLKKELKGNTNIYKIDEHAKDLDYFSLAEISLKEKNKQIPMKILSQIQNKIKGSFYILLVTGSYAENKQTKSSDLDVAFIISDESLKKPYEIALKEGELTIPEIHGYVFTESEFYNMLINKDFNYGKECAKKHIIIYGSHMYYKILLKALQNGFKG